MDPENEDTIGQSFSAASGASYQLKLDGWNELLLCTRDAVVSTSDGSRFLGRSAADFGQILRGTTLSWR